MNTVNEKPTVEALAEAVRIAKRDVTRAKILYANREADYDDMANAAKILSNAMYDFQKAKYPAMRPRRAPYQALLR